MTRILIAALVALLIPAAATAQDAVSPGAVKPGAEAPRDAMHGGVQPSAPGAGAASQPGGMPARAPFKLKIAVNTIDGEGKRQPQAGAKVLVAAMAGQMKIKSYSATSGDDGVAVLDLVGIQGAAYVPSVLHEGVTISGQAVTADGPVVETSIDVYGSTFDDKDLLVTELMTTVDIWEGQLAIMQMWTIVNAGPVAFDPMGAVGNEKYADGLPIVLPKKAVSIQATVLRGKGNASQAEVFENIVRVKEAIPPQIEGQDPLRVQIRFAIPNKASFLEYEQPMEYRAEGLRVIVPLQTRHSKFPRLDLKLTAAAFPEVGDGKRMPGMRKDMDFLVARNGHAEPGGTLNFTVEGFPVQTNNGTKVAFGLALLIIFGGLFIGLRGKGDKDGKAGRKARIRALTEEREDLFDALRDLDERYEDGELSDRMFDIEAARLRERLALVMRQLDKEGAQKS